MAEPILAERKHLFKCYAKTHSDHLKKIFVRVSSESILLLKAGKAHPETLSVLAEMPLGSYLTTMDCPYSAKPLARLPLSSLNEHDQ